MGAQLVELLSQAADQATYLSVGVDYGRPNYHDAARTGTLHAALLVHQKGRIPERFGDQNRLTFPKVQMKGATKTLDLRRPGRLCDRDPFSEGRLNGLGDRIIRAAVYNLAIYRGRNHNGAIYLA